MSKSRLENTLFQLFLRAEAEGRRDTAEHLMRALEAFYAEADIGAGPPSARDGHGAAAERRGRPEATGEPRKEGAARRDGCATE